MRCRPEGSQDVGAVTRPPPHAPTNTFQGCGGLIRDLQLEGLSLEGWVECALVRTA